METERENMREGEKISPMKRNTTAQSNFKSEESRHQNLKSPGPKDMTETKRIYTAWRKKDMFYAVVTAYILPIGCVFIFCCWKCDTKPCEKNQEYTTIGFLLFLVIIEFLYIVWMKIKDQSGERLSTNSMEKHQSSADVVYFSNNPVNLYLDLSKSFMGDYKFRTVFIDKESDIPKIKSKLVFLFIDSNDRNIILEGNQEISRIKATTVKAVQRFGGTAVVIYWSHSESHNLVEDNMFSPKLKSIQHHPVLRDLSSQNCILSIDKTFEEHQIKHLQDLCEKYLHLSE